MFVGGASKKGKREKWVIKYDLMVKLRISSRKPINSCWRKQAVEGTGGWIPC